ncbi:hypothetical protein MAUB1S_01693 [Mycolicibacterium aubagnense]
MSGQEVLGFVRRRRDRCDSDTRTLSSADDVAYRLSGCQACGTAKFLCGLLDPAERDRLVSGDGGKVEFRHAKRGVAQAVGNPDDFAE